MPQKVADEPARSAYEQLINDKAHLRKLMAQAFNKVDTDKSGFLSRGELEESLKHITRGLMLEEPSPEDVADLMREMDKNGDGKLSREEFQQMVEQVLEIISKEPTEQNPS